MKKMKMKIILVVVSLFFAGLAQIQAQKNQNNGKARHGFACEIPDLTEEQQKNIENLKVELQKKMLANRNLLREKKAKLNTLRTAEKADMKAINKVVDEIGALQTNMMKDREAHRQAIRKLLNEKQRLFFDTHREMGHRNGKRAERKMRHGHRLGEHKRRTH